MEINQVMALLDVPVLFLVVAPVGGGAAGDIQSGVRCYMNSGYVEPLLRFTCRVLLLRFT